MVRRFRTILRSAIPRLWRLVNARSSTRGAQIGALFRSSYLSLSTNSFWMRHKHPEDSATATSTQLPGHRPSSDHVVSEHESTPRTAGLQSAASYL